MRRGGPIGVVLGLLWVSATAPGAKGSAASTPWHVHASPRSAHAAIRCARKLRAGEAVQAALDALPEAAALCLEPGEHRGPLVIARPLTLTGPRTAVVRSTGRGTTIEVNSGGVVLSGFTVDGSGTRYDTEDAAVAVRKVDDVRVEGLRIVHAVFGILVERANRVRIADNEVFGDKTAPLGLRGDGIRMWEVRRSNVLGNRVHDSRDMVIWYSPNNTIRGNFVEHGRYGTHLMYSHENVIEENVYRSNVVGVFSMYSRGLIIRRNRLLDSTGAGAMGLGAKESARLQVQGNLFVHNEAAVYLDTTPLEPSHWDVFEDNLFALGGTGVVFHGPTSGNRFLNNRFEANRRQVFVEGGGDAEQAEWSGNYFDDYSGYDLDGDGLGDVPYELRSLSSELTSQHPNLSFFNGTVALTVLEAVSRLVPLFTPKRILMDPAPRIDAPPLEGLHAH